MPSDRVRCPLCSEEVSRNKFGGHLLSKKHQDALRTTNERHIDRWKKQADYLANLPAFPNWPDLPQLTTRGDNDFFCCFGCKGAWVNQPYEHLRVSKGCVAGHVKGLRALCGVVLTPEDKVAALEAQIAELKRQLSDTTSGRVVEASGECGCKERTDELETENENLTTENSRYRKAFRTLLGDKFPQKIYGDAFFVALDEVIEEMKAPPAAPKPPPLPRLNESKIAAYVAASAARDWDAQNSIVLSDTEMTEAYKRIKAAESAPRVSAAFNPPPLAPQVLTSTIRRPGKMTQREMTARGLLPA